MTLENGSRVAVIGGGPAGSFFSHFLLGTAQRMGRDIGIDIYEPRDFDQPGPAGCNNCGGIISEWLVQALAVDGINLPTDVVERGIDSYILHMDVGDVRIETPVHEKRIGAVHRGAGPRGLKEIRFRGFDSFLLDQAHRKGARIVRGRVDAVELRDGRPHVKVRGGEFQGYELMVVAMGKNNAALKMFESLNIGYRPPKTTRTYITEIYLGRDAVSQYLGSSMHVFLLNLPRLEFAALIPKGDYATMCLLGEEIDHDLVNSFVASPEVKACLPPAWVMPPDQCHCSPVICIEGAVNPFADRVVFIGDCGVTRLYKDGIGAAYRTAKAAAITALFEGVAATDFRTRYAPLLRRIATDNQFGRAVFQATRLVQQTSMLRRGLLRMVAREQRQQRGARRMSMVLWDTFTGSAPYREVFMRALHPACWLRFLWQIAASVVSFRGIKVRAESPVAEEALGKVYRDGDVIVRQGDVGDCMFVIQAGQVEIVRAEHGHEIRLAMQGAGECFGEMAIVEREARSATARASGEVRALTIDRRTFHRRVQEDPSLAYGILQKMSQRLRELNNMVATLKAGEQSHRPAAQVEDGDNGGQGQLTIDVGHELSRVYHRGEVVIRQGESDDGIYFIQSGRVAIVQVQNGTEVQLATRGGGDCFGEMAMLDGGVRSATVRALAETRVLALDKSTFLRRVHEDPSLAYRLMQEVSKRIRELNSELCSGQAASRAACAG